jgi:hypothetical protein
MHFSELIGYALLVFARVIDDHGQQERLIGCHQVGSIDRKLPLKSEIPFVAVVRVPRDDRDEQGAGLDLLADRPVPRVPAAQLALVEPDFNARSAECLANLLGGLLVL